MNREIKFRGLTKDGFVYGDLTHDAPNSTAYYREYSQRIHWLPETGGTANRPVKNGTVGQFTGLLDKNGKEIYEGDIIQADTEHWQLNDKKEYVHHGIYDDTVQFHVIWYGYGWYLKHLRGGKSFPLSEYREGYTFGNGFVDYWNGGSDVDRTFNLEVIGNIYEKPELLEATK